MAAMREVVLGTGPGALEPGELDTMDLLSQQDAWRMGDLARALRVDPSTATRAVQRLTRAGLAERRSCHEDGRVAYVALTSAGRDRHRMAVEQRRAVLDRMFEHFDEDEAQQLAELMERLVAAFDEAVGHQLAPPAND